MKTHGISLEPLNQHTVQQRNDRLNGFEGSLSSLATNQFYTILRI